MKSLDDALQFVSTWTGALDDRDKQRFAEFVPFDRLADAGLEPIDDMTAEAWGDVRPWTEEEVLQQLKDDAEFGLEKAEDERGLSSNFMFCVVNMWCILLENGLERRQFSDYGRDLFESVLDHYGWRTAPETAQ